MTRRGPGRVGEDPARGGLEVTHTVRLRVSTATVLGLVGPVIRWMTLLRTSLFSVSVPCPLSAAHATPSLLSMATPRAANRNRYVTRWVT